MQRRLGAAKNHIPHMFTNLQIKQYEIIFLCSSKNEESFFYFMKTGLVYIAATQELIELKKCQLITDNFGVLFFIFEKCFTHLYVCHDQLQWEVKRSFSIRLATVFFMRYCLSKHKMTTY